MLIREKCVDFIMRESETVNQMVSSDKEESFMALDEILKCVVFIYCQALVADIDIVREGKSKD